MLVSALTYSHSLTKGMDMDIEVVRTGRMNKGEGEIWMVFE